MKKKKILYGNRTYNYLLVKEDRKTLSLSVHPDMSIVVRTPLEIIDSLAESFVKRKFLWLEKQLRFFKKYQRQIFEKEYVSGESYLYRGKQFRLKVISGQDNLIKLFKGQLLVTTTSGVRNTSSNKQIIDDWYSKRTRDVLEERLDISTEIFGYKKRPRLVIRRMLRKWGSYWPTSNTVVLNPELIKTSTDCLDYVIIHELCHVSHNDHDKKFYKLLSFYCPNWKKLKDKLELSLVRM